MPDIIANTKSAQAAQAITEATFVAAAAATLAAVKVLTQAVATYNSDLIIYNTAVSELAAGVKVAVESALTDIAAGLNTSSAETDTLIAAVKPPMISYYNTINSFLVADNTALKTALANYNAAVAAQNIAGIANALAGNAIASAVVTVASPGVWPAISYMIETITFGALGFIVLTPTPE